MIKILPKETMCNTRIIIGEIPNTIRIIMEDTINTELPDNLPFWSCCIDNYLIDFLFEY